MYVVVLQCPNEYINLSMSEVSWGRLAYGARFETFNYGGGQQMSADSVAMDVTTEARRVGGLVWL